MVIKVLGTGCANCKKVKALAAEVDAAGGTARVTGTWRALREGLRARRGGGRANHRTDPPTRRARGRAPGRS